MRVRQTLENNKQRKPQLQTNMISLETILAAICDRDEHDIYNIDNNTELSDHASIAGQTNAPII